MTYDHRKGSYAAALEVWRKNLKADPRWEPSAVAFGLSEAEAVEVRAAGYPTDGLPALLRSQS